MTNFYDTAFYEEQKSGSAASANSVVPVLCSFFSPKRVLDVGCGVGTWLAAFKKQGIPEVLGLDGDYVDRKALQIDPQAFQPTDLSKAFSVDKKYDLAISLEVGEHLPEASSDAFVTSITQAADVVVFSAALPGQIGTHHINEQYPEYWAGKFRKHGYVAIDLLRKMLWNQPEIEWWYKQNMLVYVREEALSRMPAAVVESYHKTDPSFLTRIHPDMLNYFVKKYLQLSTTEGFVRSKLAFLKQPFRKTN